MTTPSQPGHGTATITEWTLAQGGTGKAVSGGLQMTVDFDPSSLELRYAIATTNPGPQAGPDQRNKAPSQWMSDSTTLALTLIFDSTDTGTSVQEKTDLLAGLTTQPGTASPGSQVNNPVKPVKVVRFHWGRFNFVGQVTSMSQKIDYFSAGGVPLRATVELTLQEVKPPASTSSASSSDAPVTGYGAGVGIAGGAGVSAGASASAGISASAGVSASAGISASVGTTPLTLSADGDTVQDITARAGTSVSWKVIAAANNIDNPRMLAAGTVLDLSAGASANAAAGAQVQIS